MSLFSIDADHIRRTYTRVLGEARIGRPELGSEDRAHLAGILRGQLQLLLEELEERAGEFHGETRKTADHVAARAREAPAVVDAAAARHPEQLHDMATLARSLLTLCELPTLPPPEPSGTQTPVPHCLP
ncbi:DUF6415 family natural product biosynthesis protein [Streptomyces sp. NPDC059168]|uniref:DUF6415 family natural product biosynthesis protein n=1 Tax=Streptomyces sp. NPDC059168 TaxID=3346753 RepID=UPI0036A2B9F6